MGNSNSNINSIFRKCSSGSCGVGGVGVGSGGGMNSEIKHHPKLGEANPTFSTIWGGEEESSIVFLRECDDFETKAKTKTKAIDTTLLELELNPTFSTVWAEDCDSYASSNDCNDLEMQQDEQEQEQLDQKEEVSSGSSWTSTTSTNDNSSKQPNCREHPNLEVSSSWYWSVTIVFVVVVAAAIAAVVLYVFISI